MDQTWRDHPMLRGRFHPDFLDDTQVVVHDGGPRIAPGVKPELVWVRLSGASRWPDVFRATVMNQPQQLRKVAQGNSILVRVGCKAEHPFLVSDEIMQELQRWRIEPCSKCGFSALFDAPSELIARAFPNAPKDAEIAMFTTFCPWCGGVIGLELTDDTPPIASAPETKPWWKFW